MRQIAAVVMSLTMLMGCADESPVQPPSEPHEWLPFAQGDISDGVDGIARFQIAPCAYPEMVGRLPTCALDMPFIVAHRTAILIEAPDAFFFTSTDPDVLSIGVARETKRDNVHRIEVEAHSFGDVALRVEGADGGLIDSVTIRVRRAATLDVVVDGAHLEGIGLEGVQLGDASLSMAQGHEVELYAVPRDAEGNALNAWSEVTWSLEAGSEVVAQNDKLGWYTSLRAEAVGTAAVKGIAADVQLDIAITVE